MYWLVLYIMASGYSSANVSTAMIVLPEKYATIEECNKAGLSWPERKYACIAAHSPLATNLPLYDKDGNSKVSPYPGYYCGNNPDNCKLNINCKGIIESYDNGKIFICR